MAIPVLAAGIIGGLTSSIVPLTVKVFTALGIGFVTFQGADQLVQLADTYIQANFNALPAKALAIAEMAGFADGLQIVLSAYAAQIGIMATSGALTRIKIG